MRDNRARRKERRVIVDGWRETLRAMQAGLTPLGVYTTEPDADAQGTSPEIEPQSGNEKDSVLELAADTIRWVSSAVMEKIAYGQSARGVVAEFQAPERGLATLKLPPNPLILVLDRLEKPGNVGAAFRCADAAGVDAVLCTPQKTDLFNPNAIRASLGTVFTVPAATADEGDARQWLSERAVNVLAARVESASSVWDAELTSATAFVIGSEATGLGASWASGDDLTVQGIHLPMRGHADSLNASVTAAILLFEAQRQRSHTETPQK